MSNFCRLALSRILCVVLLAGAGLVSKPTSAEIQSADDDDATAHLLHSVVTVKTAGKFRTSDTNVTDTFEKKRFHRLRYDNVLGWRLNGLDACNVSVERRSDNRLPTELEARALIPHKRGVNFHQIPGKLAVVFFFQEFDERNKTKDRYKYVFFVRHKIIYLLQKICISEYDIDKLDKDVNVVIYPDNE